MTFPSIAPDTRLSSRTTIGHPTLFLDLNSIHLPLRSPRTSCFGSDVFACAFRSIALCRPDFPFHLRSIYRSVVTFVELPSPILLPSNSSSLPSFSRLPQLFSRVLPFCPLTQTTLFQHPHSTHRAPHSLSFFINKPTLISFLPHINYRPLHSHHARLNFPRLSPYPVSRPPRLWPNACPRPRCPSVSASTYSSSFPPRYSSFDRSRRSLRN